MQSSNKSPYRLDFLLGLRGVLAFTVVIHHYNYGNYLNFVYNTDWFRYLAPQGVYSVYGFFILSGYLMCKLLNGRYKGKRGVALFYYNRLVRIIPIYFFAIAFSLFIFYISKDRAFPVSLIPYYLFWANYTDPIFTLNQPLWTISTEMQFYLLAPVLFLAFKSGGYKKTVILLLSVLAISLGFRFLYYYSTPIKYFFFTNLEVNLLFFMAGWGSYLLKEHLPKINPYIAMGIILFGIIICWILDVNYLSRNFNGLFATPLWFFYMPLLISAISFICLPNLDREIKFNSSSNPALKVIKAILYFLGITSYSAYVLHIPAFTLLNDIKFKSPVKVPVIIMLYVFCYMVYRLVEKPLFSLRIRNV
jgi:peptidoglycan/LPS O-acetylase OafA/YrhL